MIPIQILLRYNLIYIILSYNVFLSVIYSGKTCDLQQSKPACLILWRMAPVIIMGRLSKCGRDPGRWTRCRNPAQTGHWQQIQGYGKHSCFIFIFYALAAVLYRWFRLNVYFYLCSCFFSCKTSLRGCCPRHMRLRNSWTVLSRTLKPQTAAYTQCLTTSSCCPTHSSLKTYAIFFIILAK